MTATITIYLLFLGTLVVATLFSLVKFSRSLPGYQPMMVLIFVTLVFELINLLLSRADPVFDLIGRLEILAQLILICWQAKRWYVFDKRPWLFWAIIATGAFCWFLERIISIDPTGKISWSGVVCAFMITLIGIEMLVSTLFKGDLAFFKNPVFLFSIAILVFFTLYGTLEVFMIIGQYSGAGILSKAFYFYAGLGIITNIFLIRSVLCIPMKTSFS